MNTCLDTSILPCCTSLQQESSVISISGDIQDNTFDIPKHLGSHGHESHTRIRFSQTVAPHWSHFQDVPSREYDSFDFKPVQIPSKVDCRFDPVTHRYICPVCNNSYLTYASMCGHIKLKHQGQYEIHCEICGKGFQRRIHLLGHMAVHGQPMNFECSMCGAKYAHKTSLRAHERLSHGSAQWKYVIWITVFCIRCHVWGMLIFSGIKTLLYCRIVNVLQT